MTSPGFYEPSRGTDVRAGRPRGGHRAAANGSVNFMPGVRVSGKDETCTGSLMRCRQFACTSNDRLFHSLRVITPHQHDRKQD